MTSRTLSPRALNLIDSYLHLPFPNKEVACPYYNNRHASVRGGLRVLIGKGLPSDITEELKLILVKEKIDSKDMSNEQIKQSLVNHKIGVDCSGLSFHILDAESQAQNFGPLKKHFKFPYAKNILRKIICIFRPIESAGVTSFAHEKNSREIEFTRAQPGDYIVLLYTGREKNYNHMMTIYQTDYEEETLKTIHYIHSFSWPSDGKYNHGVRQGTIEITDSTKGLKDQLWSEQGKTGTENFTYEKAQEAMYVSLRRLKWF